MDQLLVFDTTLRDGAKSPGTILTVEEKLRIARQVARLQVDVIDAGFPAASEEQYAAAERIAAEVGGAVIAVLARATNPRDFEIAWNAVKGASRPRLHTFVPVSKEYREHFLKKTVEQTLELGILAVKMARQYTADVELSLMDAFRAPPEEVIRFIEAAIEAGAATVNLADTVGSATPVDVSRLFQRIKSELKGLDKIGLSIHCHNDLGLALANSLAAVAEGATQVHCTINGIGERAGNTPLEELVAALAARPDQFNRTTRIQLDQLYPTSRLVGRLTGVNLQPHKPVVGSNAFFYESAVPQLADAKEHPPYETIRPGQLGIQETADALTADIDLQKFKDRMEGLGYELTGRELDRCYQAFQELASKKEHIFNADLDMLANSSLAMERQRYKLLYLNVTAGSISVPNATVQLDVDGQVIQDAAFGHGPIDAAFKTICKMVKRFPRLVRYEVSAVTPGTDAQGEVSMRLEENGRLVNGRAVSTDIVMASARALVDGLNQLELIQSAPEVSEFTDEESWMPRL